MSDALQILLVEDDPQERRLASRALARGGYQVTEASSGAEALTQLERSGAVLVLLAVGSLGSDAHELLGRIAEAYPEAPTVVMSETDDVAVVVDAIRRGASAYVVKRPDGGHLQELSRVVCRALERHRLARERDPHRGRMELLSAAVRATVDGVGILDRGGRVQFVNRTLQAGWRRPEPEILGSLLRQFVHVPGDPEGVGKALAVAAAEGRWSGELHTFGVDPPQGVWDVTLAPVGCRARTPEAALLVAVFRDASGRHALEQLRADFLSMITHDIKVPLTVILGYTEMLTDPEPPPGEIPRDILTRIRESGETIHALVCNFLDLSRIEAGRMTLDPRPFDLGEMLAHALEHYDSTARRKGLTLTLRAAMLRPLVADEGQLERVVANLLANAIKYTPSGGRITVTTGRENGRIAVAFRDTGRGIPPDELPHLFEKYRRVREAKRTEGTGLGLFIAKTIVAAHGGDIRVESEPGVGSTFTVLLPGG